MQLTFLGAAGEVTGSSYLIETGNVKFLVDCGMFQGGREADRKNRNAFAFDPKTLDFVLLTHAHIDHSGLLPRLAAWGFRGPVYCTTATADLLQVMLKDSAHIQEKEVEWRNKSRRHTQTAQDLAPLYTVTQAETLLNQLVTVDYATEITPHTAIRSRFQDAGHILGSAIIELWIKTGNANKKIVFSGDLGQPGHPIVRDPVLIDQANIVLIESTYGNRLHRTMDDTLIELTEAINRTLNNDGGNVIIPAFTVGRTQDLLFLLIDLYRKGKLGEMDIYVDSPMAKTATEITLKHIALLDQESADTLQWMMQNTRKPRIHFVQDIAESMLLNQMNGIIIISASGMCDAGRIKHHLKYNLDRPECSIIITGFQAERTLGRRLVDGARQVRIYGQEVRVRATIHTIGGLSAHADQAGLLRWLRHFHNRPEKILVVHGELSNSSALVRAIDEQLHWPASIPEHLSVVQL